MSIPISQFIPPCSPIPWFVLYICDYLWFVNKFICILFFRLHIKLNHMIFVFLSLTSLSMTISRSIYVAANGVNFGLFFFNG